MTKQADIVGIAERDSHGRIMESLASEERGKLIIAVHFREGGTDYLRNLVPAYIECNRSKGDLKTQEFEY